jgi:protein tyrosine phosphatase (PTP) superfamily phosphohydrolase (DUF442 family)
MAGQIKAALSSKPAHISSTAEAPAALRNEAREKLSTGKENGPRPRRYTRSIALTTIILACVASTVALWTVVLRDRIVPKRFGVVVPGKVFRSGQISRSLIANVVDRHGIRTIIDLNGLDPKDADQRAEMEVSDAKGIQHLRFPLHGDATGQIERYAGAVAALVESERDGRPVLVHCAAGTQRTGACVSFYRLLVRNDPPESVYRELMSYGWDPRTNRVLLDYVNGHMRELATLLVERHTIDREPNPLPILHP